MCLWIIYLLIAETELLSLFPSVCFNNLRTFPLAKKERKHIKCFINSKTCSQTTLWPLNSKVHAIPYRANYDNHYQKELWKALQGHSCTWKPVKTSLCRGKKKNLIIEHNTKTSKHQKIGRTHFSHASSRI